jgi:hypothetical protein
MARGDVQAVWHISLASNATHDIQPGSGDEWVLREFQCDASAAANVEGGDGSNFSQPFQTIYPGAASGGAETDWSSGGKNAHTHRFLIDNGEFIRIINQSGATKTFGYGAMEIK